MYSSRADGKNTHKIFFIFFCLSLNILNKHGLSSHCCSLGVRRSETVTLVRPRNKHVGRPTESEPICERAIQLPSDKIVIVTTSTCEHRLWSCCKVEKGVPEK